MCFPWADACLSERPPTRTSAGDAICEHHVFMFFLLPRNEPRNNFDSPPSGTTDLPPDPRETHWVYRKPTYGEGARPNLGTPPSLGLHQAWSSAGLGACRPWGSPILELDKLGALRFSPPTWGFPGPFGSSGSGRPKFGVPQSLAPRPCHTPPSHPSTHPSSWAPRLGAPQPEGSQPTPLPFPPHKLPCGSTNIWAPQSWGSSGIVAPPILGLPGLGAPSLAHPGLGGQHWSYPRLGA